MEMEMEGGNGEVRVPPGFRFHPTDEELLYYYLKKKISYQPIDLDVIREVDLNRLEPWEIREKCRIGTGPQNEWYLFSHKDKKYPTGTRTNRATTAGFWKATGRDKAIFLTNIGKRIGMRKTLVFYVGRAPHGQKTDWIMHEYRLDDIESTDIQQEEGWVVCRVFKKKNHTTTAGFQAAPVDAIEDQEACQEEFLSRHTRSSIGNSGSSSNNHFMPKRSFQQQSVYSYSPFEGSMDLPHLSSPDSSIPPPTATFLAPMSLNTGDLECSQNLLRLTSGGPAFTQQASEHQKLSGDWFFLDKLLTNYHTLDQHNKSSHHHPQPHVTLQINAVDMDSSTNHHQKFPFQYLGCEQDVLKYSTR